MTMFYTPSEERYLAEKLKQANPAEDLYPCSDGVMRTAYEKVKFEQRVGWTAIGWKLRPEDDIASDVGSSREGS